MKPESFYISDNCTLYHLGPSLDAGPLPAFFYFSLSGYESLTLDPFNQPIAALKDLPIRLVSIDLPGHGPGEDPKQAISKWLHAIKQGEDLVGTFCHRVEQALEFLFHRHAIEEGKIGVGGLSRGAFLALHIGARIAHINPILGFAPLIACETIPECVQTGVVNQVARINPTHQIPELISKTVRLYCGNNDTRIGTDNAYNFIRKLTEAKVKAEHKTLDAELNIRPSIGNMGHGTSQETFVEGALWMAKQLGAING